MSYFLLGTLASLSILASVIPLIPIPHGAFRIFDFGRLQIMVIAGIGIGLNHIFLPFDIYSISFTSLLSITILIQLIYVVRFTPLWKIQSVQTKKDIQKDQIVRLFVCNVKQGNRDYSRLLKQIENCNPDLIILMETDTDWTKALTASLSNYKHELSCPQDNSYGMYLASKLAMPKSDVKFLLNDGIPSFHCTFELKTDQRFNLIAIHPDPPVPHRDTIGRDAEILLAGKLATESNSPIIVTGDLNDVAWSATTRRFIRLSQLLDPRQGRGLYNSFDARFPFLRWPLDHIFHSKEFELVKLERQPFMGSDHFPMYYELALVFDNNNALPASPSKGDVDQAIELINTEKNRDRKPIGEDWEETNSDPSSPKK